MSEAVRETALAGGDRSTAHRLAHPIDLTSATSARLTFQSWLSHQAGSRAEVQVSVDGVNWIAVELVPASDAWRPVEVDLRGFVGRIIEIRFVLEEATSAVGVATDVWRIADPRVEIGKEIKP